MNRAEFIALTAVILFVTFILGWIASWLVHRLFRSSRSSMSELDHMAQQLHDAEEERDQAVASRNTDLQKMAKQLEASQSELRAAMDGLRESRTEVEELRDYIERRLARR